jgi:hypothetical protein
MLDLPNCCHNDYVNLGAQLVLAIDTCLLNTHTCHSKQHNTATVPLYCAQQHTTLYCYWASKPQSPATAASLSCQPTVLPHTVQHSAIVLLSAVHHSVLLLPHHPQLPVLKGSSLISSTCSTASVVML